MQPKQLRAVDAASLQRRTKPIRRKPRTETGPGPAKPDRATPRNPVPAGGRLAGERGGAMPGKPNPPVDAIALRRRAEGRLGTRPTDPTLRTRGEPSAAGTQRLLHELQVHQVELEMQNLALQEANARMETLVEKYTDLYDFAPIGYFSLDEEGRIFEANLTGALLLGVERSRLMQQRLQHFVAPSSRSDFLAFLENAFARPGKQVCEASLLNAAGVAFWADLQALPALSLIDARKWCRVTVVDISALKRADEAQRRLEALTLTNLELNREILRRHAVERALKKSEQDLSRSLRQSRQMQKQLRHLSHQILQAQEEERKRVSRELHDEIAQTLVGINVHLENLAHSARINPEDIKSEIVSVQRLMAQSVDIVHRFARDLRPTMLDDLGLIPALHSYLREFATRTKVRVQFTAIAAVEQLSNARRTVLYRVAQSALTNIAQHAHASQVEVSIQKVRGAARMEIHDNGTSFDVERVLLAKRHKRLGLIGTRERVEMVGGRFTIESAPGNGTTVRAELPFDRRAKK